MFSLGDPRSTLRSSPPCARPDAGRLRLAALLLSCFLGAAANVAGGVFEVEVFRSGTEGYNVFRIPAIVTAANGDLLAFAEARAGGDASEIDLVLKRSRDQGRTWGPLEVVQESDDFIQYFPAGQVPPVTVGNPAPVVDLLDPAHPGRIWLPFCLENDRVFVTYSDDHGATWSTATEITSSVKKPEWGWYATGPVHGVQLTRGEHAGRLIIPSDHGLSGVSSSGAHVVYSDDHGQTWQIGGVFTGIGAESHTTPNENLAVELVDGRVYFNARDRDGDNPGNRSIAYSSDGGLTYAEPGFVHDPRITTPVVQNAAVRFHAVDEGDTDNIILYSGPAHPSKREDMAVRVSYDETESWAKTVVIRKGPAAYSDIVKLDDNRCGVLFETGTQLYEQIIFSYMDFATLTLGAFNGVEGDVNQDGEFNEQDVLAFVSVWDPLSKEIFLGGVDSYIHGDLNFDGDNNLLDVFVMRQLLSASGISAEALQKLSVVPEPQGWRLALLMTLTGLSRRAP